MSKGQLFITRLHKPRSHHLRHLKLLVWCLSVVFWSVAHAQNVPPEVSVQLSATGHKSDEAGIVTEQEPQDAPLPLVDPTAAEEVLPPADQPVLPLPSDSKHIETHSPATLQDSIETQPSQGNQIEHKSSSWTEMFALDQDSKDVLLWLRVLAILAVPLIPFLVLKSLASSETEVAFVTDMEMATYLLACFLLSVGVVMLLYAHAIILKISAVGLVTLGTIFLLSLLGLQRQLSRNLLTTVLMFITKVSYFVVTFVLVAVFKTLALLLFKLSYDKAKNREYASAGLMLGGGAVSWRSGDKLVDAMTGYVNGQRIPAVAAAFPDEGFWDLIALGFEGYGSRYAYQKRWKTQ